MEELWLKTGPNSVTLKCFFGFLKKTLKMVSIAATRAFDHLQTQIEIINCAIPMKTEEIRTLSPQQRKLSWLVHRRQIYLPSQEVSVCRHRRRRSGSEKHGTSLCWLIIESAFYLTPSLTQELCVGVPHRDW